MAQRVTKVNVDMWSFPVEPSQAGMRHPSPPLSREGKVFLPVMPPEQNRDVVLPKVRKSPGVPFDMNSKRKNLISFDRQFVQIIHPTYGARA